MVANLARAARGFKCGAVRVTLAVMASKKAQAKDMAAQLRAYGLGYPGAHLKSPWPGHMDLAVKDKTFAYLPPDGEPFSISVKLPKSQAMALMLPSVKPAAYGLGRSGWIAADFPDGKVPPIDVLKQWIDESYRAQALKTLIKQLDLLSAPPSGGGVAASTPAKRASKRAGKRVA
jgi:predicted DNA-binding protein (MmcQ/YjbR family)